MLGEQLQDFQKKLLKHNILFLLGKEKSYSEQQKEFNMRLQEEVTEIFRRKSAESCREWISRIDKETDENINKLQEMMQIIGNISIIGRIARAILEEELSAYYVIPFILPMLSALNETAQEECLNRNYAEAINNFEVFCSKSDITLYNLFREVNRLGTGEKGLGARTWDIYYDVKKVMKEYCNNGVLENIHSDELCPSLSLGSLLPIAGILLCFILNDGNTES